MTKSQRSEKAKRTIKIQEQILSLDKKILAELKKNNGSKKDIEFYENDIALMKSLIEEDKKYLI